jgi:hypothetical protein
MTLLEFYNTYWKDSDNGINKEFFDKLDEATKENKKLVINSGSRLNSDSYRYNLMQTARVLIEKKSIVLASKNPKKYIDDLYKYLGIKTKFEPLVGYDGLYFIILESVDNKIK